MDSLQKFLSDSVNSNILLGQHQINMVSNEITFAIHQIIANDDRSSCLYPITRYTVSTTAAKLNHKRTISEIGRRVEVLEEEGGGD